MKYIYTVISFFISTSLFSQNFIADSISKEPIESVHISYKGKGIISNEDGYFYIPDKKVNVDSISLSHIAFKSKKISFIRVIKNDTIFLQKATVELDEIVLNTFNINDTILKAIKSIDKNYLRISHNFFGFFRQSLKEDSKGIEMIEVDFISYIEGYNSKYSTKIINARRTDNYSEIKFNTIGGVLSVLEKGDFVKRKAYFLNSDNIEKYEYTYKGEIEDGGLILYKINFSPKRNNSLQFLRKGTLFIDSKSLAFVEIRYGFDEDKLKIIKENANKIKKEKNKPFFVLENLKNIIRYKAITGNKWALSSIEVENDKIGSIKNLNHVYTLKAKLVINNVKIDKAVPVKTNYNSSKDFSKAIRKFDNLDSWDDNYKLSLSNNERAILKEINEHNKN